MAAQHRDERKSASAAEHPSMVWRFARSLGGQHAGDRRDEFHSQDGFSGLAGEFACGGAMDANRPDHAGLFGDGRRSDSLAAAVDRQTGIHPAEQRGKQDLSRAALHRGKLWPAGPAAWTPHGRAEFREGERSRSEDHQHGVGQRQLPRPAAVKFQAASNHASSPRAMNRWIKPALTAGLIFAAGAAAAQNADQDRMRCASGNPGLAIPACTAVIERGREANQSLAVVYHYRGNAYLERGDFDPAIADFAQAIRLNPD